MADVEDRHYLSLLADFSAGIHGVFTRAPVHNEFVMILPRFQRNAQPPVSVFLPPELEPLGRQPAVEIARHHNLACARIEVGEQNLSGKTRGRFEQGVFVVE